MGEVGRVLSNSAADGVDISVLFSNYAKITKDNGAREYRPKTQSEIESLLQETQCTKKGSLDNPCLHLSYNCKDIGKDYGGCPFNV